MCLDWDLSVCLQYEVQRKQLRKPPALNSWLDLRATYRVNHSSLIFTEKILYSLLLITHSQWEAYIVLVRNCGGESQNLQTI